jgi:CRISPR/Cas system-associated endonuclease Cas3-HD
MKQVNKEALIQVFKKYMNAMYPDTKLPEDHKKATAKKAFKEFAKEIQKENENPQAYLTASAQYEVIVKTFAVELKSRLDKSFNRTLIEDDIMLDEYPIKVAAEMMGYKDEETVKKKIESGEIQARDNNPEGSNRKYYISKEEIKKHKRK